MNVVASPALRLRKLTVADNPAIAHVIRQVSAEYGLTADKGYTVADPNLDELYQVYSQPGHAYWVVEYEGEVVGGGGIAPLTGVSQTFANCKDVFSSGYPRQRAGKKTGLNGNGAGARNGFQTLLSGNDRFFKGSHCAL